MSEVHNRSVGIDAIYQYTGSGVQLFSGAIFYVIAARMFSTSGVGAIALFLAIIGLFNVIFSMGLGTAAQHFTSYNIGTGNLPGVRKTIFKIILWGFSLSMAGLLTLLLLSPIVSLIFLHTYTYTRLIRLLSIVLLGNILLGILNGALLGMQNFRTSALLGIVVWIVYYFGSIVLAYTFHNIDTIVFGWIFGIFLGIALELIVVIMGVKRFKGPGNSPPNLLIFRYSLPILVSGIISYGAAYTDRFIVAGLLSLSDLGIYNFALLISTSVAFIAIPFNSILMPKFSELFGNGRFTEIASRVRASSLLLTSIYVPLALGVAALSGPALLLVGGVDYSGGSVPLRIIMFTSALFVSSNILIQAIASVRKTKVFLYVSAATLASNAILSIILIPRLGLIGASIGYSSVYAASFILLYYFSRRMNLVKLDISGIIKVWISSAIMFAVVELSQLTLGEMYGSTLLLLPVYILFGAISYIFCAKLFGIFGKEDRDLVLSLFPEKYYVLRKALSFFVIH